MGSGIGRDKTYEAGVEMLHMLRLVEAWWGSLVEQRCSGR